MTDQDPYRLFTCTDPSDGHVRGVLARRCDSTSIEYVTPNGGRRTLPLLATMPLSVEPALSRSSKPGLFIEEAAALLQPGEYHPRIWRNGIPPSWHLDAADETWIDPRVNPAFAPVLPETELIAMMAHVVALHRIERLVAEVFDVVTPCEANKDCYGGAIRQVLLLAATEVESMLPQAHEAHRDLSSSTTSGSFKDWKQLFQPMKLLEWTAVLANYPSWPELRPFQQTDGSVRWWNAYNKAKHDPAKVDSANLHNMIDAYAGARLLLQAQFGPQVHHLLDRGGLAAMTVVSRPTWPLAECYFDSAEADGRYTPVRLDLVAPPTQRAARLLAQAMELPKDDRRKLADKLVESLDPETP